MNPDYPFDVSKLLSVFVDQSNDCYAIYDDTDTLIYANQNFAQLFFASSPTQITGKTYKDAMIEVFATQKGLRIDFENLDEWLEHIQQKRWKQPFRSFEVCLQDGRWILASEQMIGGKFLFIHGTEITRTKQLENELRQTQTRLFRQAYHDDLTRIPNRRAFIERCGEEINRAHRNHSNLCLFVFDIDHFKQVNDHYGHQGGDRVLKELSELVNHQLRDYDFFARVGGEEFALLFSTSELKAVLATVERIRELISRAEFPYQDHVIRCTASFGGAQLESEEQLESFLNRADKNLYLAKAQGRNQVVFGDILFVSKNQGKGC